MRDPGNEVGFVPLLNLVPRAYSAFKMAAPSRHLESGVDPGNEVGHALERKEARRMVDDTTSYKYISDVCSRTSQNIGIIFRISYDTIFL